MSGRTAPLRMAASRVVSARLKSSSRSARAAGETSSDRRIAWSPSCSTWNRAALRTKVVNASPGSGISAAAKTPQRAGIRDGSVGNRRNLFTPWAQGKDAAAWSGVRALIDPDAVGGDYYGPEKAAGRPVRLTPLQHTIEPGQEVVARVWEALEELSGTPIAFSSERAGRD